VDHCLSWLFDRHDDHHRVYAVGVPLVILPLLLVLALIIVLALIPISFVQRYRVGTSRQRARGWLATINLTAIAISTALFLTSAGVTTFWVPGTLTYAAIGLAVGAGLGTVGLWLTHWESSPDALHYTPNRLLVLGLILLVATRLLYGLWRGWESWRAGIPGESWFVAAGVAGSIAAAGVVLGYYLVYWLGIRRRYRDHERRRRM
jgi:hypothetical protein